MRQSQVNTLQSSLIECQRFVKAAKKALEKHHESEEYDKHNKLSYDSKNFTAVWPDYPKGVAASLAATKRASMDLTRALARFRRT